MKKVILFLLGFFIFSSFSYAELTGDCTIVPTGTCSNVNVVDLLLAGNINSHACFDEVATCSGYTFEVCCPGSGNMQFDSYFPNLDASVSISRTANGHLEDSSQGYYGVGLVFNTSIGTTDCHVEQVSSCPVGEYCIFSLNGLTNAHVASCSAPAPYNYRLCCSSSVYVPPPEPIINESHLKIVDIECGDDEFYEGESFNVNVNVEEIVNNISSPSDGANVVFLADDEDGNLLSNFGSDTTNNGLANIGPIGLSEGTYYIYANATKSNLLEDSDKKPFCTIDVIKGEDNIDIPPGTYAVYGECKCPSGGCNNGVGSLDIWVYDIVTNKQLSYRPDALECFLSEESVPFIGNLGILLFFLILGLFYSNEMLKNKNKLNR